VTRRLRVALCAVWCAVCAFVLAAPGSPLQAQSARLPAPGSALRVYLITVGQGDPVWEKFGHNALWFVDAADVDEAYNWGVFDFNQPHFLQRFLSGDTRYWVEAYPGVPLIDYYRKYDRSVVLQRLNFTPEQASRALAYARWNVRDENKFYRYDYFRDNCSTRVRDVIDLALGGALKRATSGTITKLTYRDESVRLVDDLKLTQLGITTALGEPADSKLSLWQSMFIPMRMRDIVRGLRVPGPNGASVPIVANEQTVYTSREYHERGSPRTLWLQYLLVGLLLAIEFGTVGRLQDRAPAVRTIFRVEVLIWSIVIGVLGLVLLLAWTSTRHVFWYRNENLLVLNPLSLWLAALVGMSWRRPRYSRPAALLAIVIAALAVVALALKALPWFTQNNVPDIALLLPVHVAIAIGLWRSAPMTGDVLVVRSTSTAAAIE
jgi:hypothetical protein